MLFKGKNSLDLESLLREVEDQAVPTSDGVEIGTDDREVNVLQRLDGLELDDDQVSYVEVQPMPRYNT